MSDTNNNNSDRLALVIQRARKSHGWSQAKLAEVSGVATNTVNRVELARPVRKGNLRAILDALDMSPDVMDEPEHATPAATEPPSDVVEVTTNLVRKYLEGRPAEDRTEAAYALVRYLLERS